jgi:hypothetical protein
LVLKGLKVLRGLVEELDQQGIQVHKELLDL